MYKNGRQLSVKCFGCEVDHRVEERDYWDTLYVLKDG